MPIYRGDWYGRYRANFLSGATTLLSAGTNSAGRVAVFRWGSTTAVARIRSIDVAFVLTTAFTAAQEMGYEVFVAHTYTVANTGGTALTLTGDNCKMSQSDLTPTTALSSARVATTADLATGTSTLDAQAIMSGSAWMAAVGATFSGSKSFLADETEPAFVLRADQGIVIRNSVLMGAAGVGRWHCAIEWDEYRIS